MSRPLSALVLAVLLALSVVAGVAGVAAGAQGGQQSQPDHAGQQGPPEHAGIPEHAVAVGHGQQAPPGPSDPSAWRPSASRHASDMVVEVRSPRASERLELVFGDEQNHAGREVAVATSAVREALGRTPQTAYVKHESGERYAVPVENRGETLAFDLSAFSTNTVAFEGEVAIDATPATDGAQYSYDVSSLEAVENFSIDVTGVRNAEWANKSGHSEAGETVSVPVGGTTAPEGPGTNGDPVLTVAVGAEGGNYPPSTDYGESWYPGQGDNMEVGINVSGDDVETVEQVTIQSAEASSEVSESVDVYLTAGGPNGTINGDLVRDGWTVGSFSGGVTIDLDTAWTVPESAETVTVEFDASGASGDSNGVSLDVHGATSDYSGMLWKAGTLKDRGVPATIGPKPIDSLGVDADDGTSASFSGVGRGESASTAFPVSTSASEVSLSGTTGRFEWSLEKREVSESVDPTVEVNGNATSYSGTLADDETTSLSTDESWIREGTNRVNVSMAAPSNGPTPQVGLAYSHAAVDEQSVGFDGETWSERYNVSKTFASDQQAATLTIPFASDRVVGIRDVDHRVDGGSWQSVTDYQLNQTELTVEFGDVQAGVTHEVRATGTKVQVTNGSITVLEPTWEGNDLDSEVRVDSADPDFSVDVSGTEPARFVHYTVEESWNGDPSAVVSADGSQTMDMAPPDGATMRMRTIPIEARPVAGTVDVTVEDDAETRFRLENHSDDVNVTYYDTIGGETYALIDAATGDEVMRDQAESPVTFWAPVGDATYLIDVASSTGSGTTGEDVAVAVASDGPLSTLAIFVGLAGSIVGFVFVGRRFGARGWRQNLGLVAGGVAVAVVAIEAVTAGSFLGELASGGGAIVGGALGGFIESGAGAVVSGIGMFWAVYAVHERFGLPPWFLVVSGVAIGVFTLDNVTDGALSGGLAEVSALLWLGIVFGAIALLWRVLQPRPITINGGR